MRRYLLTMLVCGMACVMLAPLPVVLRPNPYARAKVGDWAEYQTIVYSPSRNPFAKGLHRQPEPRVRLEVTAQKGKSLLVEKTWEEDKTPPPPGVLIARTGIVMMGTYVYPDSPVSWGKEQFGDSTLKPFLYQVYSQRKLRAQGTVTLHVQGQAFVCTWTQWEAKTIWGEKDVIVTVWRSAEAPLDGTVKILIEDKRVKTEVILVAFGRGK